MSQRNENLERSNSEIYLQELGSHIFSSFWIELERFCLQMEVVLSIIVVYLSVDTEPANIN